MQTSFFQMLRTAVEEWTQSLRDLPKQESALESKVKSGADLEKVSSLLSSDPVHIFHFNADEFWNLPKISSLRKIMIPEEMAKTAKLVWDGKNFCWVDPELGELLIDFDEQISYRRKNLFGKNDLLLRALGLKKAGSLIVDLTAGVLRDSVFLTQQGHKVVAIERHPLIYGLLQVALTKTQQKNLQHLTVLNEGALDFLKKLTSKHFVSEYGEFVSALYFDPMYPDFKGSALPKKEMQFLRRYVGEDLDRLEVLSWVLAQKNRPRFVFKKHPQVREKISPNSVLFEGKSVCYEMLPPLKTEESP